MSRWVTFKSLSIMLITVWILLFILIPNLMLLITSFLKRDAHQLISPGFTLTHYRSLFDPVYFNIFWKSFVLSGITTLITLLLGFPFAFILTRFAKSMQRILLLMIIIPFWTSSLIRTYALIIILKANGTLNTILLKARIISAPLEILYTDTAVYIGLVYTLLPFMILPLFAALEKIDFKLIEAGFDLGASPCQVFRKIILPLSLPGVMAGSIMVFLPAMGLFFVPDLLGGAKSMLLGNLIRNQFLVSGNWPFGAAASIFMTVVMLIMLLFYFRSMKHFNMSLIREFQ
jgi:spermidine/putrescine transport system permease protein